MMIYYCPRCNKAVATEGMKCPKCRWWLTRKGKVFKKAKQPKTKKENKP